MYTRLSGRFATDWLYFLLFAVFSVLCITMVYAVKKKRLQKIPSRDADAQIPLVNYVVNSVFIDNNAVAQHQLLDKARVFIVKNFERPIRMEEISTELSMGIRQLQRFFQTELNTSPKTFILTIKL